jgi:hypothetical protein
MKKSLVWLTVLAVLVAACGANDELASSSEAPPTVAAQAVRAATPTTEPIAPAPSGLDLQPKLAAANIPIEDVVTLLPPDAIPAVRPDQVMEFMVSAAEAEALGMDPEMRLIGVSIAGESEAYPLPFLSRHEIVNTEISGRKLAVTW